MLKSLLPDNVKVKIRTNEIGVKSNLTTIKTRKFTKKSFFYTILGFTESSSGPLNDHLHGFVQMIPASCKIKRPIIITGIDKVHLKCNCSNGSIVSGCREPILCSFGLDQPPGLKNIQKTKK